MKTEHYKRVEEFMRTAKQEVRDVPAVPSEETRRLRGSLLLEEVLETLEALGVRALIATPFGDMPVLKTNVQVVTTPTESIKLADVADGCADVSVVLTGTLISCGIHDNELLEEVDRSNLAKFAPGWSKRADGKLLKPKNWQPPQIAQVIANQSNGSSGNLIP